MWWGNACIFVYFCQCFNHFVYSKSFTAEEQPPSTTSVSEFMTSSHYPISTGPSPPLTSSSTEPHSSPLSYVGENMSAAVSTYLQQNWGTTIDTYNSRKQHNSNSEVPKGSTSSPPNSAILSNSVDMQAMERSPNAAIHGLDAEGRRRSSSSLAESRNGSQMINESPYTYGNENYTGSEEMVQRSSPLENSILPSIPEKTEVATSGSTMLNMSGTSVHQGQDYSIDSGFHSGSEHSRRPYRHNSYSGDRRSSNITPPSPNAMQHMYGGWKCVHKKSDNASALQRAWR